jgi:SAM-dependent methyltransferase
VTIFEGSARYYDTLYADKDYAAEADYVDGLIQQYAPGSHSLLDLGCGTGRHAIRFAEKGYTVVGIDLSPGMLKEAQDHKARLPPRVGERLTFEQDDLRELRLDRQFDAVAALFHVVSYQTSNESFIAALTTAKAHLETNGIFVFDCWYGPGVLTDPPVVRVKRLRHGSNRMLRITEPVMHINENLVDVNYSFVVAGGTSEERSEFEEKHTMRYFFAPEISLALQMVGFKPLAFSEWMTNRAPDSRTWNLSVVAQLIAR